MQINIMEDYFNPLEQLNLKNLN